MASTGHSIISIAKDLNERLIPTKGSKTGKRNFWHSLTIRRMIKNSSYIGETYFGVTSRVSSARTIVHPQDKWTLLENVTPAIISEELFNDANAQLDKPKVRTGRPKNAPLVKFYAWSISV
jgi:Recombinase.